MKFTIPKLHPEEHLELVEQSINSFNYDQLQSAIDFKNMRERVIRQLTANLTALQIPLDETLNLLKCECYTYNRKFDVREKNYITNISERLKLLNKSVKELDKIVRKFCPRQKQENDPRNVYGNTPQSAYDFSFLSPTSPVQLQMFSVDEAAQCVQELYEALDKFLKTLGECITICEDTEREECSVRNNKDLCLNLMEQLFAALQKELNELGFKITTSDCSLVKQWIERTSEAQFAQDNFHGHSKASLMPVVLHIMNGDLVLSDDERLIFDNDIEQAKRFRTVISQIDTLVARRQKGIKPGGKINAKLICMILMLMNNSENYSLAAAFRIMYERYYANPEHQYEMPKDKAIYNYNKPNLDQDAEYRSLMIEVSGMTLSAVN